MQFCFHQFKTTSFARSQEAWAKASWRPFDLVVISCHAYSVLLYRTYVGFAWNSSLFEASQAFLGLENKPINFSAHAAWKTGWHFCDFRKESVLSLIEWTLCLILAWFLEKIVSWVDGLLCCLLGYASKQFRNASCFFRILYCLFVQQGNVPWKYCR